MKLRVSFALFAGLALASCGGIVSPSQNIVENVTGTIPVGGAGKVHTFDVSNTGEYTLTVTSLSPPVSAYFTMYFGQSINGQCQPLSTNSFALLNTAGSAGPIQKGSYCVQLADSGFFTTAETYNLKMSHPN